MDNGPSNSIKPQQKKSKRGESPKIKSSVGTVITSKFTGPIPS